ncbi:MAG: flagellar hook-length control protein FliK [Calditrichaeota bacterium]|nr:MAG: flagellar hook-length control protein FliK [Calditrichota bacterium]
MDFSGLLFGAGANMPENEQNAMGNRLGQISPDALIDNKVGFWQYLQHFLKKGTAENNDASLNIANIGFAKIDINPSAGVVEDSTIWQHNFFDDQSTEPTLGNNGIENTVHFREAFAKIGEKQLLSYRELADLVSLAKNSNAGDPFAKPVLQELAEHLLSILEAEASGNNTGQIQPANEDQTGEQPNVKLSTDLQKQAGQIGAQPLPTSERMEVQEELDSPDLNPAKTAPVAGKGQELPFINDPAPTPRDSAQSISDDSELDSEVRVATEKLVDASEKTQDVVVQLKSSSVENVVTENAPQDSEKIQVRPVVLASKTTGNSDLLPKINPAFHIKTKDSDFIVSVAMPEDELNFKLEGMPLNSGQAQNVIQVVVPETSHPIEIPVQLTDEPHLPGESEQEISPNHRPANQIPNNSDVVLTQSMDNIETSKVDTNSGSENSVIKISPEPAELAKSSTVSLEKEVHRPSPNGQKTAMEFAKSSPVSAENSKPVINLNYNEDAGDETKKSPQTVVNLEKQLPQKLNIQILKIDYQQSENMDKHTFYKAETVTLSEKNQAELVASGKSFPKTIVNWHESVAATLQKQNAAHDSVQNESKDSQNSVQNAVKMYAESESSNTQTGQEKDNAGTFSEFAEKSSPEKNSVVKDGVNFPSDQVSKLKSGKSRVMQQVDRVKSFENIRSQIATHIRKGQSEIQIQLKPESLGSMRLLMSLKNGLLNVNFMVESMEVKSMLEKNIDSLRETLADRGIKAEHVEVQAQQQVVHSNRSEYQEQRYTRDNTEEQREKQAGQQKKHRNNRDGEQKKHFDQYL